MERISFEVDVNGKPVILWGTETPKDDEGTKEFDIVVTALKAAGTESYTVSLLKNNVVAKTVTFPQGNWIRPGSKVRTRHGVCNVTSIEDTTHSRDRKEGKEVKKFDLDATFRGRKKSAIVLLDNGHFTYTEDGITVLEY